MNIEKQLAQMVVNFSKRSIGKEVITEAKKRVVDSLACFYGAFSEKPGSLIRKNLAAPTTGESLLWGTTRSVPADLAAWANGTCVRTLDYNDTYLSLEPCHPSDLISSLWAACEVSGANRQGQRFLKGMVLGYEVLCRLCDSNSIRVRGWDHVTYLPLASAAACAYVLGLNEEQTRHALSLAVVGNNAMRQTRVGTISDWKAACAAYAARSGLWAARLAKAGFTGPSDIFSGRNGFFNQVSGPFQLRLESFGRPWKMMQTHIKFFPAEHHAQSVIEAAIVLRDQAWVDWAGDMKEFQRFLSDIRGIEIETFKVAVDIIGSEKEKWIPTTRETADHSMPYLTVAALLDGDVTLKQYEARLYAENRVRRLMGRVTVKHNPAYSRLYPRQMPSKLTVQWKNNSYSSIEVMLPKGYAGRPMSMADVEEKFHRLSSSLLKSAQRERIVAKIKTMEKVNQVTEVGKLLAIPSQPK